MTTVVDLRVGHQFSPAAGAFWEQFWPELTRLHPTVKFVFIVSEEASENNIEIPNLEIKIIKNSSFKWLDRKALLTYLKEVNAGRYISLLEFGFCVHIPEIKLFQKKDIMNPIRMVAFSEFLAKEWQNINAVSIPIELIKPAYINITTNLSWTETESVKTNFTGGRDFFLFSGDINEKHLLIDLLKAFTLFKKWQQSNMQLVIAGYTDDWTAFFEEKLDTYIFKKDVVLLKDIPEEDIAKLTAAAYAIVYPNTEKTMPYFISRSIQTGTALIASATSAAKELTTAFEWVDNNNLQEEFAKAMILLYKDENHKNKLVEKEKAEASSFDAGKMLEHSWEIITGN